jgi:glycine cleavage system H protein
MPMSGEVVAVNEDLNGSPQLINQDAFGAGWLVRFRPTKSEEYDALLDTDAYERQCQEEAQKGGH